MTKPKFPKMNPEVKAKWLAALRSRKYKQGKDTLHAGDRFCCLGVLCDISDLGIWDLPGTSEELLSDGRDYKVTGNPGGATKFSVYKWAGLNMHDSLHRKAICHLSRMNDTGKKFYQIARWIERNL
jgi:hypothetical protein